MWMTMIVLLYLVILGIVDVLRRKVPVLLLGVGGILLVVIGICQCMQGELRWMELIVGIFPGLFMVLVAWFTKKAGHADGVVLIQLGVCLGYQEVLFLFCLSMLLLSGVSVLLLFLRKVGRETKMPYLAFLAMIFLVRQLWGGLNA